MIIFYMTKEKSATQFADFCLMVIPSPELEASRVN